MNQAAYRKLISGQSTGTSAVLLRLSLAITAGVYSVGVRLRNFLYSKAWLKIHTTDVPVISVGNITVGGTGKTPLVIWLYRFLQQKNVNCAILTRGYKSAKNQRRDTKYEIRNTKIDEPAILAEGCPEAKIIVNSNRVTGAAEAVNEFGARVIIMDDGFQHRRLARNLDIVTIDGTQPFGYGKLLPAGLLREPAASLKRADATVLTRCDQTAEAQLTQLEEKLQQVNPDMIIARSIHTPICAKSTAGEEISIEQLKGKKIFAFCGIGNPDAFFSTIKGLGANLIGSKVYDDHHHYTDGDIADICEQAQHSKADLILTTQKDWFSTQYAIRNTQYEIPFAYLAVELKFLAGEDKLKELIEDALAGKILSCKNNSQ